jgi:signal transduction histidine kinase/DNA-binding NarL/FixJ family response regulator
VRIGHKLLLMNAIILVIALLVPYKAHQELHEVGEDFVAAANITLPDVRALDELRIASLRMVSSTNEFGLLVALSRVDREDDAATDTTSAASVEEDEIQEAETNFRDALAAYAGRTAHLSAERQAVVDELAAGGAAIAAAGRELRDGLAAGAPADVLLAAKERQEWIEANLLSTLTGLVDGDGAVLRERTAEIDDTIHRATMGVVWIAVSLLLSVLGFSRIMARSIARPLRELTGATTRIARGEFVPVEAAPRGDEIGTLVTSFRAMSEELQRSQAESRSALIALREAKEAAEAAQAAAEAAARTEAEFLAVMSHEIRTPMTAVIGMAELLAVEPLPPEQRAYVGAIRSSGQHLLAIINDILDYSRIEAGGLELERVDVELSELLEQVRSLMAPPSAERGLVFEVAIEDGAPRVARGDPTRLRQILLNLVGNALKFTTKGGVTVTLRSRGDALRFEVRDTGIGIPEAALARLFERFRQADSSTTRRYGGTGLGLAISKRLVDAMGGRIGVESEPGQGSLFWFEVPFEPGRAPAAGRDGAAVAAVPPLRLLIAEDVATNRVLLRGMLGRHGHAIVFATDGAEALELAAKERFDAVLMDVQMPVMDGLEATRRIRRLPAPASRVPIVALTAGVIEQERRHCLAAGMDGVLTKPVVWTQLLATLADVAAGRLGPTGSADADEEVPQEIVAVLGEDGLGVELDAHEREFPVGEAHDLPVLASRGDPQGGRQAAILDDERVVAGHA